MIQPLSVLLSPLSYRSDSSTPTLHNNTSLSPFITITALIPRFLRSIQRPGAEDHHGHMFISPQHAVMPPCHNLPQCSVGFNGLLSVAERGSEQPTEL